MTVLENVMIGAHTRSRCGIFSGMLNAPWSWKEERRIHESAARALETAGISALQQLTPLSLSFGQQRAVEFARALTAEPALLLLDEPAAGLNMQETAQAGELIKRVRDSGITILIIEHDMSLIMGITDEIVVLSSGKKIAEGPPERIQRDPEVIRVYLGEDDADNQEL